MMQDKTFVFGPVQSDLLWVLL